MDLEQIEDPPSELGWKYRGLELLASLPQGGSLLEAFTSLRQRGRDLKTAMRHFTRGRNAATLQSNIFSRLNGAAAAKKPRRDSANSARPGSGGAEGAGGPPGFTTLRGEIESLCQKEGGYPQQWPRHKACPACGAGALAPRFAKYNIAHGQCGGCGFVCVDPYPPDEILTKLYSGAYYTNVREYFERPLLEGGGAATPFSAPRDILVEIVGKATSGQASGTWLDVGGGIGAFARLIRQLKPDWRVKLNEFNAQSVKIARETFNLDVVTANPSTLVEQGETFDVVSSVAVLEHIPEPLDFIKSYAALVRPGGWLVTVVPHFTALNAAISQGSSPNVVPPFHTSLFNVPSLRSLFERVAGLELIGIEQGGPAAFELTHHTDFGDYWDITIPSREDPAPRSIQLRPYGSKLASILTALTMAGKLVGNHFAKTDGRSFLIAYCRRTG